MLRMILFARTSAVRTMYLFCPRCNTQHLASSRCPRCSSRLLSPSEASDLLPIAKPAAPPPTPKSPGFTGRIVVGSIVALGLQMALWEWVSAATELLGMKGYGGNIWLAFGLRFVSTTVGGILAGAGRANSFATGAFAGGASAAAWLTVDAFPEITLDVSRLITACVLVLAGGGAAVVGGWIWPQPIEVKAPDSSRNSSLYKLKKTDDRRIGQPIDWVRVVIGASIAIVGVLGADLIRQGMARMPQGTFNNLAMTARSEALIAGFVAILAGAISGATTGRGWRQGAISGIAAGLFVITISATLPSDPPLAVQFVIDRVNLDSPGGGLAIAGGALFALVTIGGWFGGQLMPVLRHKQRLES